MCVCACVWVLHVARCTLDKLVNYIRALRASGAHASGKRTCTCVCVCGLYAFATATHYTYLQSTQLVAASTRSTHTHTHNTKARWESATTTRTRTRHAHSYKIWTLSFAQARRTILPFLPRSTCKHTHTHTYTDTRFKNFTYKMNTPITRTQRHTKRAEWSVGC